MCRLLVPLGSDSGRSEFHAREPARIVNHPGLPYTWKWYSALWPSQECPTKSDGSSSTVQIHGSMSSRRTTYRATGDCDLTGRMPTMCCRFQRCLAVTTVFIRRHHRRRHRSREGSPSREQVEEDSVADWLDWLDWRNRPSCHADRIATIVIVVRSRYTSVQRPHLSGSKSPAPPASPRPASPRPVPRPVLWPALQPVLLWRSRAAQNREDGAASRYGAFWHSHQPNHPIRRRSPAVPRSHLFKIVSTLEVAEPSQPYLFLDVRP